MSEEQKKPAVQRDAKGRFVKSCSGNPRGRTPLPPEFREYARQSPARLRAIADDPDTPVKLKAEIEQEQAIIEAEAAAERALIEAEAAAQRAIIEAEAKAEAQKKEADAKAYAGEKEAEANEKIAASLSDDLIDYKMVEQWNGELPTYVGGEGTLPILDLTGKNDTEAPLTNE